MRAALPRPRYDQLMAWGWKVMLPLALVNLLVTGGVLLAGSSRTWKDPELRWREHPILQRSLWRVFLHAFRRRVTVQYPEQKAYLPPRWRGRIILSRDPDGGERCVACYLCAVACPVDCIALAGDRGRARPPLSRSSSASISRAASSAASARRPARPMPSSSRPTSRWANITGRTWSTRRRTC